ncbi:MAG: flagellar hook-associated protein FlgK [Phycisphaerales bacterium JB063]
MGLNTSLQIGASGLLSSQAAIQATGNNLSNLATEGYHRTDAGLAAVRATEIQNGIFIGQGVQLQSVSRMVDEALEARLRGAVSDQAGSLSMQNLFSEIEAIENELSSVDLSTRLGAFFNAWSDLANNPQDLSLRTLIVEEAATLTDYIQDMRGQFGSMQQRIDDRIGNTADTVNGILDRIADLNNSIVLQEGGTGGESTGLRDQRDLLLTELSEYMDISTVPQAGGGLDIYVGSLPVVINGQSRGIVVESQAVDGQLQTTVRIAADNSPLNVQSGELGALIEFRGTALEDAIDVLDTFTNSLVFEINRLHSQSSGLVNHSHLWATEAVADTSAILDRPEAGLNFTPEHGSFELHVTQLSTGQRVTTTIYIDLDGINSAGVSTRAVLPPGDDTTLDSLTDDIDDIDNIHATIGPDGRLHIEGDSSDFQFSFSNDTSGVLAALGINTFFTGSDAFDVAVHTELVGDPRFVAGGRNDLVGDNTGALEIARMRSEGMDSLNGLSMQGYWNRHVEGVAIQTNQAREQLQADTVVMENLRVQQQAFSGVNTDEETISLLKYQRMYQANARFIGVVDELMQTLLNVI